MKGGLVLAATALAVLSSACTTTAVPTCSADSQCDDGLYCNGTEICDVTSGKCQLGTPPACDDGVACTVDFCDEASRQCRHTGDSTKCPQGQACFETGCAAFTACTEDADCDDGVYCNGVETCNTAVGACVPGTSVECDDGVACTVDLCDESSQECRHVSDDNACDAEQRCDLTAGCAERCLTSQCNTACTDAGFPAGDCSASGYCTCTAPETCTDAGCDAACTAGGFPSGACSTGTPALCICAPVPTCADQDCDDACVSAGYAVGACSGGSCVCTPAAPAPGTLTGTAVLFGHTDSSGITVSVLGTSQTATTAADGSYSLSVDPGVYTVVFTKAPYLTEKEEGLVVQPGATTPVPAVTLLRARVYNDDYAFAMSVPVGFTSDGASLVILEQGAALLVAPASGAGAPTVIDSPVTQAWLTPDGGSVVYRKGISYLSKRLGDASAPVILGTNEDTWQLPWHVGAWIVFTDKSYGGTLYRARTDGTSGPVAVYAAPSGERIQKLYANDDRVVFLTGSDGWGTGVPVTLHVVPMSGGISWEYATGFDYLPWYNDPVAQGLVTPDLKWVLVSASTPVGYRCLMARVDVTGTILAFDNCFAYRNGDYGAWPAADSSGFAIEDHASSPGYALRGLTTTGSDTVLSSGGWGEAGVWASAAIYRELDGSTSTYSLKWRPIDGSTPARVLDSRHVLRFWVSPGATNALTRVVWFAADGTGAPTLRTSLLTASSAMDLTTTGGDVTAGLFAGSSFFYLRGSELHGVPVNPPSTSDVLIDSQVLTDSIVANDPQTRLLYAKADRSVWSVRYDRGGKVRLFTTAGGQVVQAGPWALSWDETLGGTRVSRMDGTSLVEEPLSPCSLVTPFGDGGESGVEALVTKDASTLWVMGVWCADGPGAADLVAATTALP